MTTANKGIVIKSEERRLVYGEVYAPMQIDTDEEAMTAEEVEKMAHSFLMKARTAKVDVSHSYVESGCAVVESFIARKDDPDGFLLGAWVVCAKIVPDDLWEAVKKGELNGFSFAGPTQKEKVRVPVTVVKKMTGCTEKSAEGLLPIHEHSLDIVFDDDGRIVSGITAVTLEHSHQILKTTATESAMEHSHRMILIDNE